MPSLSIVIPTYPTVRDRFSVSIVAYGSARVAFAQEQGPTRTEPALVMKALRVPIDRMVLPDAAIDLFSTIPADREVPQW